MIAVTLGIKRDAINPLISPILTSLNRVYISDIDENNRETYPQVNIIKYIKMAQLIKVIVCISISILNKVTLQLYFHYLIFNIKSQLFKSDMFRCKHLLSLITQFK